jgi:hypothetical protein
VGALDFLDFTHFQRNLLAILLAVIQSQFYLRIKFAFFGFQASRS